MTYEAKYKTKARLEIVTSSCKGRMMKFCRIIGIILCSFFVTVNAHADVVSGFGFNRVFYCKDNYFNHNNDCHNSWPFNYPETLLLMATASGLALFIFLKRNRKKKQ